MRAPLLGLPKSTYYLTALVVNPGQSAQNCTCKNGTIKSEIFILNMFNFFSDGFIGHGIMTSTAAEI